jgi:hypothetical protein
VQARTRTIEQIARGVDNALVIELTRAGLAELPASGTITVYDAANTAIVDAAAVTPSSPGALYLLLAALTTNAQLGMGWRCEWRLTLGDGTIRTFVRAAALVRTRLHPPATPQDLYDRVAGLAPSANMPISAKAATDYDRFLDAAWLQIERKLLAKGRRPWLITGSYALHEAHVLATLALIFEDFASRLNQAFAQQARDYRAQFAAEWADIAFEYAPADDGVATGGADPTKAGTATSVWLGTAGIPRNDVWR